MGRSFPGGGSCRRRGYGYSLPITNSFYAWSTVYRNLIAPNSPNLYLFARFVLIREADGRTAGRMQTDRQSAIRLPISFRGVPACALCVCRTATATLACSPDWRPNSPQTPSSRSRCRRHRGVACFPPRRLIAPVAATPRFARFPAVTAVRPVPGALPLMQIPPPGTLRFVRH